MKETKSRRVLWARLNRTARRSLCAALAAAVDDLGFDVKSIA